MDVRRIHLIGRRDNGKTTLIVALVDVLKGRGLRVGTIKHSGHDHELDHKGKDSWAHGRAGASPSAVVTPGGSAVFQRHIAGASPYDALEPIYRDLDIVLVEGDVESGAPMVEVWRAMKKAPPLAQTLPKVRAIVTDDPLDIDRPLWPRADLEVIADRLLEVLADVCPKK